MKIASNSNHFSSKSRVLLGFLAVLLIGGVLLAGFGAVSKAFAARNGSPQAKPRTSPAPSYKSDVASNSDPARRLDEHGNRPQGSTSFLPLAPRNTRAMRPAGNGDWFSLGPPGGDVFDAAVSTTDSGIVLAGIAPDGSFGGTLYRSTDAGETWSEVPQLNGISVFDIEFTANGAAYIGTQNSVRQSTDGGMRWTLLSLGIGPSAQVIDVALVPSNPGTMWAGMADATGGP